MEWMRRTPKEEGWYWVEWRGGRREVGRLRRSTGRFHIYEPDPATKGIRLARTVSEMWTLTTGDGAMEVSRKLRVGRWFGPIQHPPD